MDSGPMNYHLMVLTHGDGPTLERCLESFAEHVTPAPARLSIFRDGPGYTFVPDWPCPFHVEQIDPAQLGFCKASSAMWHSALYSHEPYVFWLEHDFEFIKPVDLHGLAAVLDAAPELAQMSLMRDAVSEQEKAAGGLFELRRDHYTERETCIIDRADTSPQPGFWEAYWLEHRSYFTTNPSLMRRDFMGAERWPDYPAQCEGRFGIDLVERGYQFGVWGDGTPAVNHIGERTGSNY